MIVFATIGLAGCSLQFTDAKALEQSSVSGTTTGSGSAGSSGSSGTSSCTHAGSLLDVCQSDCDCQTGLHCAPLAHLCSSDEGSSGSTGTTCGASCGAGCQLCNDGQTCVLSSDCASDYCDNSGHCAELSGTGGGDDSSTGNTGGGNGGGNQSGSASGSSSTSSSAGSGSGSTGLGSTSSSSSGSSTASSGSSGLSSGSSGSSGGSTGLPYTEIDAGRTDLVSLAIDQDGEVVATGGDSNTWAFYVTPSSGFPYTDTIDMLQSVSPDAGWSAVPAQFSVVLSGADLHEVLVGGYGSSLGFAHVNLLDGGLSQARHFDGVSPHVFDISHTLQGADLVYHGDSNPQILYCSFNGNRTDEPVDAGGAALTSLAFVNFDAYGLFNDGELGHYDVTAQGFKTIVNLDPTVLWSQLAADSNGYGMVACGASSDGGLEWVGIDQADTDSGYAGGTPIFFGTSGSGVYSCARGASSFAALYSDGTGMRIARKVDQSAIEDVPVGDSPNTGFRQVVVRENGEVFFLTFRHLYDWPAPQ